MRGKLALVTGGMGGIGSIIAQELHRAGAKVVVSYNKGGDHAIADQWKEQQKKLGYDFSISFSNICDFESASKMVMEIEQSIGNIDILVNNAGITEDVTLMKMEPDQWNRVINTNLNSIYNVTRNILNKMIESRYGRIINISSINGQRGQFGQTNYAAAKAGIHGFTKALAYEVAKKGITVNTVSPGYVRTAMTDKIPGTLLDDIVKQIPVGRLAEPEEVARVVSFLASEKSAYITGANISINGGQHMY